jgi:hypothetical protein
MLPIKYIPVTHMYDERLLSFDRYEIHFNAFHIGINKPLLCNVAISSLVLDIFFIYKD